MRSRRMSRVFRRSACVPLLLAGTLLVGCDQAQVPLRDLYARDSDCKLDWGDNGRCEDTSMAGGGHGWYGPVCGALLPLREGRGMARLASS